MKTCRICQKKKPNTEFHRATGMKDGHRSECKSCFKTIAKQRYNSKEAVARATAWQLANPERVKASRKKRNEEKKDQLYFQGFCYRYNLSFQEGEQWMASKGQPCPVCGDPADNLDHNHLTKKIRGWLCGNCNRGLGMFKENPEFLRNAALFLETRDPGGK